ncbi:hypothetical protein [Bradyrhizobium sp. th.b2]|uniref:hypothetical protein n=1 Tax=Bradyrhizobium sp. th-b2 TaxID=172088 RepID=UPI00040D79C1|nr:hypothetical protein [Bradyrhizobium sp. th.b2]
MTTCTNTDDDQPDLVDEHFRPFVRALGNLVITFALCEASLLELVSEMLGDDELKAVAVLKAQDAKDQVLSLIRSLGIDGYDLEELVEGVDMFWTDKAARNRLVHDEWYPSLLGLEFGNVGIRGLTRAKIPKEVFGMVDVADVWRLALRFRDYDGLFSHRSYVIQRQREGRSAE